jgi:hypothetical protein
MRRHQEPRGSARPSAQWASDTIRRSTRRSARIRTPPPSDKVARHADRPDKGHGASPRSQHHAGPDLDLGTHHRRQVMRPHLGGILRRFTAEPLAEEIAAPDRGVDVAARQAVAPDQVVGDVVLQPAHPQQREKRHDQHQVHRRPDARHRRGGDHAASDHQVCPIGADILGPGSVIRGPPPGVADRHGHAPREPGTPPHSQPA